MTPGRRARIIVGCVGILVGVVGFVNILVERRAANERERMFRSLAAQSRENPQSRQDPSAVTWEGSTYRPGDRVRIRKWAGTFKPEDTGAPVDVQAARGAVGVVIRGEKRQNPDTYRVDPSEPLQVVRVRWLAQRWSSIRGEVALPEFEATIHVSHIESDR